MEDASSQENGAVREGGRLYSLPVAVEENESLDDLVVNAGVEGVCQFSEELDPRCDSTFAWLSYELLAYLDGPAFEGVWKIPMSPTGEAGSKTEEKISKGFRDWGDGDDVSDRLDGGFELSRDPKMSQVGDVLSRSANEENERKDVDESRWEVGSKRRDEASDSKRRSIVAERVRQDGGEAGCKGGRKMVGPATTDGRGLTVQACDRRGRAGFLGERAIIIDVV